MFNSSEFWKRMVRGKTNPKGFNYTPEKLRKEYIEDNHIECKGSDIYQDGIKLEKKKFHYNYQAKYAPAKYQEVVDIRHKGKKKREKRPMCAKSPVWTFPWTGVTYSIPMCERRASTRKASRMR